MARSKKINTPSLTPSRSVRARVRRLIHEYPLIREGDRVLVGVSGGPDSACLLLTLAALRSSLRFELHAAYFDHRLRGVRAAARERRFVSSLTEALGVPLSCGEGDVRAHARGRSLEEAARELRYRFLAQVAREAGCVVVAVGHTRDDQAETVLLHLLRGSGLRGLAGMAPSAPWPVEAGDSSPRLIRPLLALSRDDTERCCREAGVEPIADPSNRSPAFLRNRIRLELIPQLRRYNPRIEEALSRFADAAAADVELLERLAAGALAREPAQAGAVRLSRRRLAALPAALQRHTVRLAVARLLGESRGLADRHVRAVLRANDGPTGKRLDLPRGVRVEVTRDGVVLSTLPHSAPAKLPDEERTLPVPGSMRFGRWRFETELIAATSGDLSVDCGPYTAVLDAKACGERLHVRRRRRGDRFHPLGMKQAKKLQDFFVDAHVPRVERDAVPLVCGERGIAWVVGQRPAEWAKVTRSTRAVLLLRAVPPKAKTPLSSATHRT